jgi:hypothetical protein
VVKILRLIACTTPGPDLRESIKALQRNPILFLKRVYPDQDLSNLVSTTNGIRNTSHFSEKEKM